MSENIQITVELDSKQAQQDFNSLLKTFTDLDGAAKKVKETFDSLAKTDSLAKVASNGKAAGLAIKDIADQTKRAKNEIGQFLTAMTRLQNASKILKIGDSVSDPVAAAKNHQDMVKRLGDLNQYAAAIKSLEAQKQKAHSADQARHAKEQAAIRRTIAATKQYAGEIGVLTKFTGLKSTGTFAEFNKQAQAIHALGRQQASAIDLINRRVVQHQTVVGRFVSNIKGYVNAGTLGQYVARRVLLSTEHMIMSFVRVVKQAGEAYSNYLGYRNALQVVAGSQSAANERMMAAIGIARDLKLDMGALIKEYSKFTNAMSIAGVAMDESQTIFRRYSVAARVLNMSGEQISGMFLALEQMISKGFVSMEELRRQLGQHIPGAFALAAESMGYGAGKIREFYDAVVTGTMESKPLVENLSKLLEEKTGKLLPQALQKTSAAVADMRNSLVLLQLQLGKALQKPITAVAEAITWVADALNNLLDPIFAANEELNNYAATMDGVVVKTSDFVAATTKAKEAFNGMAQSSGVFNNGFVQAAGSFLLLATTGSAFVKVLQLIGKGLKFLFSPITLIIAKFSGFVASTKLAAGAGLLMQQAMLRMGLVIGSLVRFFTGPVGIISAIGTLGFALYDLYDTSDDVAKFMGKVNHEVEGVKEAADFASEATGKLVDKLLHLGQSSTAIALAEANAQIIEQRVRVEEAQAALNNFYLANEQYATGARRTIEVENQRLRLEKALNEETERLTQMVNTSSAAADAASSSYNKLAQYLDDVGKAAKQAADDMKEFGQRLDDQMFKIGRSERDINVYTSAQKMLGKNLEALSKIRENGTTATMKTIEANVAEHHSNIEKADSLAIMKDAYDTQTEAQRNVLKVQREMTSQVEKDRQAVHAYVQDLITKGTAEERAMRMGEQYAAHLAKKREKKGGRKKQIEEVRGLERALEDLASVQAAVQAMEEGGIRGYEEQERVTRAAAYAQRILNEERRKGIPITEELKNKIYGVAEAISLETKRLEKMKEVANMFENMTRNMTDALADFVQTGKLDFKSLIDTMIAELLRFLMYEMFAKQISGFLGIFSGWVSPAPSANGNVFQNGRIIPHASGGIVSEKSYFPMRGGIGSMAEEGPEAIMPLKRMSNGKLGVYATGTGGGQVVFAPTINTVVEGGKSDEDTADTVNAKVKSSLENMMAQFILKQQRPGGMLAK